MPRTGPPNSLLRSGDRSNHASTSAGQGPFTRKGWVAMGRSARVVRALVALLVAVAALTALAPLALAEVEVQVRKIYATTERKFVDPKLKDLESHFGRFGMFTSFTADSEQDLKFAAKGESHTVSMPDGKQLKLIYRGASKGYLKLRFELGDMKMNVRIHDGGLFFHSGVPHRKGRMVLAIKATSKE